MEADWEVEVGGGAPVIEALWPGFVDLRQTPQRLAEIAEAAAFPPLAGLLRALNSAGSPVWTSKCDVWEPAASDLASPGSDSLNSSAASTAQAALACYIDLLPRAGQVFAQWQQAETFCREWVARLVPLGLSDCRVDLVVRQAIAGDAAGFGVTAYVGAVGPDRAAASRALAAALAAFADSRLPAASPSTPVSKLQWVDVGE
jgi:hypothetical protein